MNKTQILSNQNYGLSLLLSIAIHLSFFIIGIINFHVKPLTSTTNINTTNINKINNINTKPTKPIVTAELVDNKKIEQAYLRQQQSNNRKKAELIKQQKIAENLKKEAAEAKKKLDKTLKEQAQIEIAKKKAMAETALEKEKLAKELRETKALIEKNKKAAAQAAQAAQRQAWLDNEFNRYVATFKEAIEENRTLSSAFPKDTYCKIHLRLLPDGSILSLNVTKSSGYAAYDAMSETAVYKAAPFEMPNDTILKNKLSDLEFGFYNSDNFE